LRANVDSRLLWNRTGIRVEAGARYKIVASGRWIDKKYESGPDGYDSPNLLMKLAESRRRVRSAKWFALIGAVDEDESTQFVIGNGTTFTAPRTGRLTCFANDWRSKLDNNCGSVTIEVTRLEV
jgi:hypothetical protein